MDLGLPIIALVTRETRLQGLKARWATARQAAFRMEQAVEHEKALRRKRSAAKGGADDEEVATAAASALADADEFEDEDQVYQRTLSELTREIDLGFPVKRVDRTLLSNFDFFRCMLVVVLGPDGLVANTAKYVGELPIVGINPDPTRNDGVLLPFSVRQARSIVRRVIDRKHTTRAVTLAEATLNDGQRMLAFNDFFIGAASHVSARYTLEAGGRTEQQSSSGILVSTGAGSTGWLSSVFNMAAGISARYGGELPHRPQLAWEDRRLIWAVREPFLSRHSGIDLVSGVLDAKDELVIGSQMPGNGVIFSDGIETDFLEFGPGSIARVRVAEQQAKLVVG